MSKRRGIARFCSECGRLLPVAMHYFASPSIRWTHRLCPRCRRWKTGPLAMVFRLFGWELRRITTNCEAST